MMRVSSIYRFVRLAGLAVGLHSSVSPVLALEINNNASATLNVQVDCNGKKDSFKVSPDQVGPCPSNVCKLGTPCSYTINAKQEHNCTGKIDGGSGLEVSESGSKLSCVPYDSNDKK